MTRRSILGVLGSFVPGAALMVGCGGPATGPMPEQHDQVGEHLNYPAGGPDSPDYKKLKASKAANKAPE
jgi:hypothetical protein